MIKTLTMKELIDLKKEINQFCFVQGLPISEAIRICPRCKELTSERFCRCDGIDI